MTDFFDRPRNTEFGHSLAENEQRRPGISEIYWELRKRLPHRPWRDVMALAKDEWHKRNPVGVPR